MYRGDPYPELENFCLRLAAAKEVHIAWLTDTSPQPPLQGFIPHQDNLSAAIQIWLEQVSVCLSLAFNGHWSSNSY